MIFAFSPAPRRETRIRGLFSHVRECLPLFRTGAKGVAAFMPRGSSAKRCTNATPIFFPEKENGRRPSKRKAFTLAVSISKSCTRCALHSRWQLCCLTDVAYPLRVIGCGVHGFAMNPCKSLPVSTAPYYREARVTLHWAADCVPNAVLLRSPLWSSTELQFFYFDAKSVFLMDRNLFFLRPHKMFTAFRIRL